MEDAIRDGVIYWHAFPFNGQLEFMDEELIRQSIRLTHALDARFGYLPKMTLSQVAPSLQPVSCSSSQHGHRIKTLVSPCMSAQTIMTLSQVALRCLLTVYHVEHVEAGSLMCLG